jgi:glutamate synthase domain-containing protein 1
MFVMRKLVEHDLLAAGFSEDDVYFCSCSSATVVYKGQLTPDQVRGGISGFSSAVRF